MVRAGVGPGMGFKDKLRSLVRLVTKPDEVDDEQRRHAAAQVSRAALLDAVCAAYRGRRVTWPPQSEPQGCMSSRA